MYLPVVTKRNTLMFSVWCQSKLLTADCFCIEMSGDAAFKSSIDGRILPNCETLRLSAGTVLELHDSLCTCHVFNKYYKNSTCSNICLCLFVLPCNFHHSSTLTTNVSDNNKQYLLHFSAAVVITKCSGLLF